MVLTQNIVWPENSRKIWLLFCTKLLIIFIISESTSYTWKISSDVLFCPSNSQRHKDVLLTTKQRKDWCHQMAPMEKKTTPNFSARLLRLSDVSSEIFAFPADLRSAFRLCGGHLNPRWVPDDGTDFLETSKTRGGKPVTVNQTASEFWRWKQRHLLVKCFALHLFSMLSSFIFCSIKVKLCKLIKLTRSQLHLKHF